MAVLASQVHWLQWRLSYYWLRSCAVWPPPTTQPRQYYSAAHSKKTGKVPYSKKGFGVVGLMCWVAGRER